MPFSNKTQSLSYDDDVRRNIGCHQLFKQCHGLCLWVVEIMVMAVFPVIVIVIIVHDIWLHCLG